MKQLIVLIILLLSFKGFSQKDTIYSFGINGKTVDENNWVIKKKIDYHSAKKISVTTFKKNEKEEKLLFEERIKKITPEVYKIKVKGNVFSNGIERKFEKVNDNLYQFLDFQKGKIKRKGFSKTQIPLLIEGEVTEYFENGRIKSISVYKNNELISNKNWLENGDAYIDNIFYSVNEEPTFPRGMSYVHKHILKIFKDSQLDLSQTDGVIKVGFVVMENGRIDGVQIIQGINGTVDGLALHAFKTLLGEWKPAVLYGENVRCFQIFPINFIFRDYDFDYVDLRGSMLYWEIN